MDESQNRTPVTDLQDDVRGATDGGAVPSQPSLAVAFVLDDSGRLLLVWNTKWGAFTLPMTKVDASPPSETATQSAAEHQLVHSDRSTALAQESRTIAQRLLETRSSWPIIQPSDPLWHLATEAEAHFLVGNQARSIQLYEQASKHPLITPADWRSIKLQRTYNDRFLKANRL